MLTLYAQTEGECILFINETWIKWAHTYLPPTLHFFYSAPTVVMSTSLLLIQHYLGSQGVTQDCYVMHVLSACAHWLVGRLLQLLLCIQAIEITATAGLNAIYTVHWQCSVCTVCGQWNSSIWCWFDVNYIDKWYLIKRTWYIMCLPYSVLSKLYSLCWVADCFYTQNGSGFCCVLCDWKCGHGSTLQEKR